MKGIIALGIAAASMSLSGMASAELDAHAPWPTANRDLRHTSRAPFIGPQSLKVRWTFDAGDGNTVWGPVVGRDGTIYAPAAGDHNLYALRPDGTVKWHFDLGATPCQHAVIGGDGTIYATGSSLFAIMPDGQEKWHFDAPGLKSNQSPVIGEDDTLYQTASVKQADGTYQGTLYAIDAATGKQLWFDQYNARVQAPISFGIDGDPIMSIRQADIPNVVKVDTNGKPMWSFTGPGEMRSATVGDDGTLYMAASNGESSLIALDPATGTEKWRQFVRGGDQGVSLDVEFPSLGNDGSVYVGSELGEVAAFSPKGDAKWKFHTDDYIKDPVTGQGLQIVMGTAITDALGHLYVPSPSADLWEINSDGTYMGHLDLPEDAQALFTRMAMGADGTLYSGSLKGILYAFGEEFTLGDGNGDGKVSVPDAMIALQKALGLSNITPQDVRALDVAPTSVSDRPFGDGQITVADATAILKQAIAPRDGWPYPAN